MSRIFGVVLTTTVVLGYMIFILLLRTDPGSFFFGLLTPLFLVGVVAAAWYWTEERPSRRCDRDGHTDILQVAVENTTQFAFRCKSCKAEALCDAQTSLNPYARNNLWTRGLSEQARRDAAAEERRILQEVFHNKPRNTLDEWRRRHIG